MADQAALTSVNKKDVDLFVVETDLSTMTFPGRKTGALNRRMQGQKIADESVRLGDVEALAEQVVVDGDNTYILARIAGDTVNKVVKVANLPGNTMTPLTVSDNDTHDIDVNSFIHAIIFSNSSGGDIVVDVGTTDNGTELIDGLTVSDGATFTEFVLSRFLPAASTLHFTLDGDSLDIILIKLV